MTAYRPGSDETSIRTWTRHAFVLAAIFILIVLTGPLGYSKDRQMPEIVSVEYVSNEFSELPVSLRLAPSRAAVLRVPSSQFPLSEDAAGLFSAPVPERLWVQIVGAVSSPEFEALAAPQGVLPGEVVREIALNFSDGTSMRKYAVDSPQAFDSAEQPLVEIEKLTAQTPWQALRAFPLDFPSSATTGMETVFRFTFSNVGQEPVQILDPKARTKTPGLMELGAIGVSTTPEGGAEQEFWELGPRAIASIVPEPDDKGFIEIAPGQGVTVEIVMPPTNLAGGYNITFTYPAAIHDKEGKVLQEVELVSEANDVLFSGVE